jgi:uncharacterized metal-binding protein
MKDTGKCAMCKLDKRICMKEDGRAPVFCSTVLYPEAIKKSSGEYQKREIREFARQASLQESECYINRDSEPFFPYPVKPRLQEIIEFSRRMNYRKLGLAFCYGLRHEASILNEILEAHNFEVISVMCKVGGQEKSNLDLNLEERVHVGAYETMCNPIAQAEVLNQANTDFNIMMGLCVGHDSLFMKYSQSMCTVFAVKDRVLGHNPMAAIYTAQSYLGRFRKDQIDHFNKLVGKKD